ncbi:hypothetical protein CXX84_04530 [Arthrobacter sp. AFG7.2]|uniref:hypothetical protein n=1 Tax=Arthrobacter sp. AFG7.2 TaxID=1688693 RepID=UPI000C9DCA0C|nr:hypothetical protein [Arthrobacter sp. AFG7.2]PNI09524.1 hypothetical protein CXX84_04530 [Arthrobacter sp. AFG7.2]
MSIFDFAAGTTPAAAETGAMCSRKACRAQASWQLLWNNPKIHSPERRKIWLACADHRDWLEDYLQTRGLWKETLPLEDLLAPRDPGKGR